MTHNRMTPPKLATFLLNHLLPGNPALIGDLAEEFRQRQSPFWYWRQVVGIVAQMVVRDIQQSPVLVVSVMASGAILTLITPIVHAMIMSFDEQLFVRGIKWFYVNDYRLPSTVLNHPWLITAVFYALIGWTVGRLRGHKRDAVVVTFTASVFACGILSPLTQVSIDLPGLSYHFAFHSVPVHAIRAILTQHFMVNGNVDFMNVFVFNVIILPSVTLIGGLWAGPRGSHQSEGMA
jgi:hypothetical protein